MAQIQAMNSAMNQQKHKFYIFLFYSKSKTQIKNKLCMLSQYIKSLFINDYAILRSFFFIQLLGGFL